MGLDYSEVKDEILVHDDQDAVDFLATENTEITMDAADQDSPEFVRLPTGKTEHRLIKDYFQRIHDSAGRLRETFFNLQGALRLSSNKEGFIADWLKRSNILQAVQQKLSEAESMMMLTTGAGFGAYPVVSNLEAVRASNKSTRRAQRERVPQDVRAQYAKGKRKLDVALKRLAKVQTPLVEAHRPNKKRKSEINRNKKNYEAAVRKRKLPKELHSSLKTTLNRDHTMEI